MDGVKIKVEKGVQNRWSGDKSQDCSLRLMDAKDSGLTTISCIWVWT